MAKALVLCLSAVLFSVEGLPRPNWLKPCSRSDPKFNECAVESAKHAVPLLLNGDRKLGLPSFNPFEVTQVNVLGSESFNLELQNLKCYGLDKLQVESITTDFDTKKVSVKTFIPKIEIVANYAIDGKILFLPLKGSGPCKLSLVNGTYVYNFTFDLEKKNGTEYAKINDALSTYDYDVAQIVLDFKNLFNGDQRLGEETNKLLNEGWQELNKELKPSIVASLLSIYAELAKKIYSVIPYNELVLP